MKHFENTKLQDEVGNKEGKSARYVEYLLTKLTEREQNPHEGDIT